MGFETVPKAVSVPKSSDADSSITGVTGNNNNNKGAAQGGKIHKQLPSHCSQLTSSQDVMSDDKEEEEEETKTGKESDDQVEVVVVPRNERDIGFGEEDEEEEEQPMPALQGMASRLPVEMQQVLLDFREREANGTTLLNIQPRPCSQPTFAETQARVAQEEIRGGSSNINYGTGGVYYANRARKEDLNIATAQQYFAQEED
ncbi:hypothetical protein SEMRO_2819_G337860.1 [Seminavis robusta]|uniref:Uncharacterized protein n=1 Tax=Seminavis robusta TaxID=568900 RepID=A0A9N8F2D7_9STRA|nr:hypothetical protein SEMRO_2819_G337860.1 [Seminavis robusta]|eukprot:Sro2819_g337860.1 n/a (202) ;mRNA; r:10004-10609